MSYEASVRHSGNNIISTLGGQIRLEEGRGRLAVYDSNVQQELTVVDRDGLKSYNPVINKEAVRVGRLPDGEYGAISAIDGKGLEDIYGSV